MKPKFPVVNKKERRPLQDISCRTYNDVASLSASKLKALSLSFNVDNNLPKKARIVFLCHCLGITTTGNGNSYASSRKSRNLELTKKQFDEIETLTPRMLYSLPNDKWSTDLTKVPEIDDTTVKKYLLQTDVLSKSSSRTYKLSRPYQLKDFVHSIKYYSNPESETFGVIAAQCNPSQATNKDEVKVLHVIIDKITGLPYSGYCTCTVGFSETCGHIGAALFRIADLVASGVYQLDLPTCTDTLCGWTNPKGSKSVPETISNLKIKKKDSGSSVRRTAECFGLKVSRPGPPTYDAVAELRASLINATHSMGQYCPAVHVLNARRFCSTPVTEPIQSPIVLQDRMNADSDMLAYSKEVVVETTPLPIPRIPHKTFIGTQDNDYEHERLEFVKRASVHTASSEEISHLTMGQSVNPQWFDQRAGCITATRFNDVLKTVEGNKTNPKLVDDILQKKGADFLSKVPAIKWGRTSEDKARRKYEEKFSKFHQRLTVTQHGLVVSKELNYVRGSPDGIVSCDCHPGSNRLLEIKCPYSARYMSVSQAVDQKKITYLRKEEVTGKLVLKAGIGTGYYEQIQGLLGITGIKLANLVVWTTIDMVVVPVKFDESFYSNRLLPACEYFFGHHIVPSMLINSRTLSQTEEKDTHFPIEAIASSSTGHYITLDYSTLDDFTLADMRLPVDINSHVHDVCRCQQCNKVLPDDGISDDNDNASVGCDCSNCGGCNVWFCWPCARYDQEWADENIDWYCPNCTRNCDIVY